MENIPSLRKGTRHCSRHPRAHVASPKITVKVIVERVTVSQRLSASFPLTQGGAQRSERASDSPEVTQEADKTEIRMVSCLPEQGLLTDKI